MTGLLVDPRDAALHVTRPMLVGPGGARGGGPWVRCVTLLEARNRSSDHTVVGYKLGVLMLLFNRIAVATHRTDGRAAVCATRHRATVFPKFGGAEA